MQIAIDGPASAGKSTIAKLVAKKLGFIYCDTGAMYRTVTYMALKDQLPLDDETAIMQHLAKMVIRFAPGETEQQVFMNDEDVTLAIREPDVTNNVSQVSALPRVRTELVKRQRDIAATHDIVMDGRDIGTTVLPNAALKIFMVASVTERAKRRYKENVQKGITTPLATLEAEIAERDRKDSHRAVSPLRQASDAIRIDTTDMSIDEVVARILTLVAEAKTH
ncbi:MULTISPECIES: (d)CMP kinase [Lacticaseibacillus]|uniref:Cytidylate kinase n=2 Tax=Lacticaseibacillus TaxID=2759736 RepID=A0AAN1C8C6_LACCA|nr:MULTISPECIES: (d)CMP kinase [Lacticaseibacillus]ARY91466.1 cytidylate kinase [Lacticaseibacillus casei]KAB1968574.1 (d)CMP kinase [Lacticaseibacillus casei]WLV82083.1 (d)CMP kinase [Lacticaseibacillus sp. NCIMB 15473]WNX25989.1 (d)CMP kinase [Lacticaseibacillus casei]WNX28762.1 (d)CMP kinase [Lacticaseibacillus casei]